MSNYRANQRAPEGTPTFITYAFLEGYETPSLSQHNPFFASSYSSFTSAQKGNFRKVVSTFEQTAGIRFVEVDDPDNAAIQIFNATGSIAGGWANYPIWRDGGSDSGYLVVDGDGSYNRGSYDYLVMMHELGHSLGLEHPFEGPRTLRSGLDTTDNTVMSYTIGSQGVPTWLQRYDITALRELYGPSGGVGADWSWRHDGETFHLTGGGGDDSLIAAHGDSLVAARAGNDSVWGRSGDDVLHGGDGADWLRGGRGDDRVFGGAGDDTIEALLRGQDILYGGAGHDLFIFENSVGTVYGADGLDTIRIIDKFKPAHVKLGDDLYRDTAIHGFNVERFVGGDMDDKVTAGRDAHILYGGPGDDSLTAGGGDDKVYGGGHNDNLFGGHGDDVIGGGTGVDRIYAGAGDDTAYGWHHRDTIWGHEGHDELFGGWGGDVLFGGSERDLLNGGRGRDMLYGNLGKDTLIGLDGDDVLDGGFGADRMTGGAGADTFVVGYGKRIDVITDYVQGEDEITLRGDVALDLTEMTAAAMSGGVLFTREIGGDVVYGFVLEGYAMDDVIDALF